MTNKWSATLPTAPPPASAVLPSPRRYTNATGDFDFTVAARVSVRTRPPPGKPSGCQTALKPNLHQRLGLKIKPSPERTGRNRVRIYPLRPEPREEHAPHPNRRRPPPPRRCSPAGTYIAQSPSPISTKTFNPAPRASATIFVPDSNVLPLAGRANARIEVSPPGRGPRGSTGFRPSQAPNSTPPRPTARPGFRLFSKSKIIILKKCFADGNLYHYIPLVFNFVPGPSLQNEIDHLVSTRPLSAALDPRVLWLWQSKRHPSSVNRAARAGLCFGQSDALPVGHDLRFQR